MSRQKDFPDPTGPGIHRFRRPRTSSFHPRSHHGPATVNQSFERSLTQLYRELRNEMFIGTNMAAYSTAGDGRTGRSQLLIAIGSSSAIAGWTVLKDGPAAGIWAVVAGLTTVLAVAQPILNLSKDIERYSKLFMSHASIYDELVRIVDEVERRQDSRSPCSRHTRTHDGSARHS